MMSAAGMTIYYILSPSEPQLNPACVEKSLGKGGGGYIVIPQLNLLIFSLLGLEFPYVLEKQSAKHCHMVVDLLMPILTPSPL